MLRALGYVLIVGSQSFSLINAQDYEIYLRLLVVIMAFVVASVYELLDLVFTLTDLIVP